MIDSSLSVVSKVHYIDSSGYPLDQVQRYKLTFCKESIYILKFSVAYAVVLLLL